MTVVPAQADRVGRRHVGPAGMGGRLRPEAPVRACLVLLAAAAVVGCATWTAPAVAHASLASATPADGATVDDLPPVLALRFTEPVTIPIGGVRLFGPEGDRIAIRTGRPDPATVEVVPPATGTRGTYILTWRAVSADGHAIRGATVFGVGTSGAVDADLLARLVAGEGETTIGIVAGAVRAVGYGAVLVTAGAAVMGAWAAAGRPAWRWTRIGALVGLVAALLTVPLQAMVTTGLRPAEVLAAEPLRATVSSTVGIGALARATALAGVLASTWRVAGRAGRWLPSGLGLAAAATFVVDGHTRTVDPVGVVVAADLVHLVAGAVWTGGLVVAAALVREARAAGRPPAAARTIGRFSTLAATAMAAIALAGVVLAWATVRAPRALATPYGWMLVVKLALVVLVLAAAAVNRRLVRRVTDGPAHDAPYHAPATAWERLWSTVRLELVLVAAVLLATAFLVDIRPAADAAGITSEYQTTVALTDDLDVQLLVDPNRAGRNEIHVQVFDRAGRPVDVADIGLRLSLPARDIGPIVREPFPAGPGHAILSGPELSLPGQWTIEILVAEDRFDEQVVEVPVVVNP